MGRGFGRGTKVQIVTHAQAGNKGKKTPKGLRSVRQKKRNKFLKASDEQTALEESLGLQQPRRGAKETSLAQDIAGIQFAHCVNKRQKGFKQLRKHIIRAVKSIRRRNVEKGKRNNEKKTASLAAKYELLKRGRSR